MRHPGVLVTLVALLTAACEHRPPPGDPAPPARPVAAVAPAAAPAAAPEPPPPSEIEPDVSERCLAISEHIVGTLIADTKDPTQQAAYTTNRAQIIRRTAERCTRAGWSDAKIACYRAATSVDALQVCHRQPS